MASPAYETGLVESVLEAPGTMTFRFEKPDGYGFVPGQNLLLTAPTREGEQTKTFTISSAPSDPWLEITTRMSGSAFKDGLAALEIGDTVRVSRPTGWMTLPEGTAKVAFLVGGVGVTPARSILRDSVQRSTGLGALLFYGNLDQDSIPFGAEFATYETEVPSIRVVHVLMQPKPGWDGETGFITADVVRRHTDPHDGRRWVVAGPPAMIDAMEKVLDELAIPREDVSIESFAGYA